MIYLYDNDYFLKIKKKKNITLTIYFITLGVAILICAGLIVANALEPYNSVNSLVFKVILVVFTCLFTIYSGIYLIIVYGRINSYYNQLVNFLSVKKTKKSFTFLRENPTRFDLRGVSYYIFEVLEWSNAKKEFVERTLYVDAEMELPQFNDGEIFEALIVSNTIFAFKRGIGDSETKSN